MADPRQPQFLLMNFDDAEWHGIVELQPWTDFELSPERVLLDEDGLPFQCIATEAVMRGLRRIAFNVRVPAFGYRLLRFAPGTGAQEAAGATPDAYAVRTSGWEVRIDPYHRRDPLIAKPTIRPRIVSPARHIAAL